VPTVNSIIQEFPAL